MGSRSFPDGMVKLHEKFGSLDLKDLNQHEPSNIKKIDSVQVDARTSNFVRC